MREGGDRKFPYKENRIGLLLLSYTDTLQKENGKLNK